MRRLITRTAHTCFSLVGYLIIGMAGLHLSLPWFLPVTLDPAKVEHLFKVYYQDLKVGSAHVTWEHGRLNVLLQDVRTPKDAAQSLNARRLSLQPNFLKSLWLQKWVFHRAVLHQGSLDLKLTTKTLEFGSLQLPLDLPKDPPVYFQRLQFHNVQIALQTPKQTLELSIPEVRLVQQGAKGTLKANMNRTEDKSSDLSVFFEFERGGKGLKHGQLNLQGRNQELNHVFEMIHWPGAQFKGQANFQFWATFHNNDLTSGLLDLSGDDITLSKSNGDYHLNQLAGRFAYKNKEGIPHWFGKDLTLIHNGQSLPSSEFYIIQPDSQTFEMTGTQFDLSLIHFILQDNPKIHHALKSFDLEPTGLIPYVRMSFKEDSSTPFYMLLEAQKLSFKHGGLEVKGLAGKLYFEDQQLHTHWQGSDLNLANPEWFEAPLTLHHYQIKGVYDLQRSLVQGQADGALSSGALQAQLALALQNEPQLDLNLFAPKLEFNEVLQVLPLKKLNPDFVAWLNSALVSGHVEDLGFHYQGALSGFFDQKNPKGFRLETKLKNSRLHYNKQWPDLERLDAALVIDHHEAELKGIGTLKSSKAQSIYAHIPDLRAKPQTLLLKTEIEGPAQDVWDALATRGFIAPRFYDATRWQGQTRLGLNLDLPLSKESKPPRFYGQVDFKSTSFEHDNSLIEAKQLSGTLEFDEKTVHAQSLHSLWKGQTLESDLILDYSKKDPVFSLMMSTQVAPSKLHDALSFLPGKADVKAQLNWHLSHEAASTFSLEGDLNDLAMELPSPLGKVQGEKSTFSMGAQFIAEDEMLINVRLADKLLGLFKFNRHEDGYQPVSGHVRVGPGPLKETPTSPWFLEGYLPTLDQNAWQTFLSTLNLGTGQINDSIGFYLQVDEWLWNPQAIKALVIEGQFDPTEQSWFVDMTSPKIQGVAHLPLNKENPWSFNMDHVYLSKEPKITASEVDLPDRGIIVNIRTFEGKQFKVRDFNLQLMPNDEGHAIQDFSFKTNHSIFDSTGVWTHGEQPSFVTLKGQVTTRDAGEFLSSFGKSGSIRKGRGIANFDLSFSGDLFNPNRASLKGQGELSLEKGYIQGVNAGFGRLLSLINIDTIQRRLQLDFSDVTDEGFAFDTLAGHYQIGQGKLKTDYLTITAPSANIEFTGELGLVSEQVAATIVVMPNVTGSLPLAATIATGNPAVGAAVWLMDKVLGRKIQEMTRYNYTVTGTLDAPSVKEEALYPQRNFSRRSD